MKRLTWLGTAFAAVCALLTVPVPPAPTAAAPDAKPVRTFYVVAPEQFPYPQPQRGHPRLAPVREALEAAGLTEWACEIYARHRGRSAEVDA